MSIQKTNENSQHIYNISQGNLLNGAKKFKDYNFAYYIGGDNNGSSQININVSNTCIYYLSLKYISYEPNLSFKININNVDDNKVYYTDFLSEWSINRPLIFTIPIILNNGDNIIEFYGNENNNAPYLGDFSLELPIVTNDLSKGILENNAYVDYNTNFVNAVGGPKHGSVTVSVTASIGGAYNLILSYICGDNSRSFKLNINGVNSIDTYTVLSTGDWGINNIQNLTIPINLNLGNNTIRFYGDDINYAPKLGTILLKPLSNNETSIFSTSKVYKISSGTLGGGASIDKTNNVVIKLGGIRDGFSKVTLPIDIYGNYLIKLKYLNGGNILKIDINGVNSETIFNLKRDKTGVFSVSLPLVVGVNELKFHGNGKDPAPDLESFTIDLLKDESSQAFLGNTADGASILPKGILTGLGGTSDGKYIIEYIASDFGWYNIYLTVDTSKGNILALDINLNIKDMIYNIPKYNRISVFIISFLLEKGKHTFVFHGDYINIAPDILKIEIKLSKPIKDSLYNFSDGTLENGAIKNLENNLVSGVGGINNGEVTINVNINVATFYDLNIKYLGKIVNTPLKIDVLDEKKLNVTTSTICILPPNYFAEDNLNLELNEYIVTIPLIKGINYIKFYGNGIDVVPQLSYVSISKSDIQQDTGLFSKTYSVVDLAVNMGYTVDKTTPNFINRLGTSGLSNYLTLFLRLPKASQYKIDIKYLKLNDNEKFYMVFPYDDKETFNPPKTNSLKEQDAKIITLNKFLRTNANIYFLTDDSNTPPLLGEVTITELKLPKIKSYTILSIELHNGAQKYGIEDFITFIGGPQKGFVNLLIKTEDAGNFDLGFKYLCGFNERILSVDINEGRFTNVYKVPLTLDWEVINAQTFTIPLRLKRGNNSVKLKGDFDNFTPILGKFNLDITKAGFSIIYDTSLGTFKNGAKVNRYGLVTNIGGPNKGEVSIKVNVKYTGKYNGIIEYKPIGEDFYLEAVINSNIYHFENNTKDKEWSLADLPTLKVRIPLISGENIITFRGSKPELFDFYAPFLGAFTLTGGYSEFVVSKILSKGSYDLTKGELGNNADVIGDFVTNLGFNEKNSVTIKVNVTSSGFYFMTMNFTTDYDSFLRFDINGEDNGKIFFFENSNCFNREEEFKIKLQKGENTIKFYGITKNFAPNINII